jgi:MarR family 2-MHQ and catechol resistance regulon transcriptional repressor
MSINTGNLAHRNESLNMDERYETLYDRVHESWSAHDSFDRSTIEMILSLYRAHAVLDTVVSRTLSRWDLSVSTFNILMLLHEEKLGLPLHVLGELLVVSRPNVTRLVASMVDKGLVVRSEGAEDRRVRIARLTPKGHRLAERLLPQHLAAMRELLGGFRRAQRVELRRGLQNLADHIASAEST